MTAAGQIVSAASLHEISKRIEAGKLRVALPLVGFGQRLSEGEMGEIEAAVLKAKGLDLNSFRVQNLPGICGKGGLRPVVSPIRDFNLVDISPTGENSGDNRVKIGFTLLRGSYATILLREIMKPQDPIEAGF
jgi:tRNA pseudouridine13 synthase